MGTVVISLDAELAWGYHQYSPPSRNGISSVRSSRDGWFLLADLFDEHSIPATWAVVGGILEETPDVRNYRLSPDPAKWQDRALLERITGPDVDHEIGFHSYTHLDFRSDETAPEQVDRELRRCRELADSVGLESRTFVYPSNGIAHRDRLADHGFICYRGRHQARAGPMMRRLRKLSQLASGRPQPLIVTPTVDEWGLVNIPPSLHLYGFEGPVGRLLTSVRSNPVVALVKRGLEHAIARDGIFHIWFHPNDLRTSAQIDRLEAVVEYIADQRDRGRIETKTMGQIASEVLSNRGHEIPDAEVGSTTKLRPR